MSNHRHILKQLGACSDARGWYDGRDSETAWRECARGDWLLWIAAKLGVDRKLIVLAACDCAELAVAYLPRGEQRPQQAIETARAWCQGTAPIEDVRSAAAYAADAAEASSMAAGDAAEASSMAAGAAADAASYAAYAAEASSKAASSKAASYASYYAFCAFCAFCAADASSAFCAAADASCADAARASTLAVCADIVRTHLTWDLVLTRLKAYEDAHPVEPGGDGEADGTA